MTDLSIDTGDDCSGIFAALNCPGVEQIALFPPGRVPAEQMALLS